MEKAALIRAMHQEPEDETLRLVFADWLQEHGEEARAQWIRASCELARSSSDQPGYGDIADRVRETFARCVPEWWEVLIGVSVENRRGLHVFSVRSKAAVNRVRKARWIPHAFAEGWLQHLAVGWSDGELAREVARWPSDLREVSLFVRPAPQISDEGLRAYLEAPRLDGLDLPGHATRHPSIRLLGERSDLRVLHLDGINDQNAPIVFEQVGRLTGVRQLTIQGLGRRPNDEDLLPLAHLTRLRELHLSGCSAVTDRALHQLRGLTELRLLRIWSCSSITPHGLTELQQALPRLEIAGF